MNKLFLLQPEVAGGFGPGTVINNFNEIEAGLERIPEVLDPKYIIEDWLGDDLLESFPCFFITNSSAEKLIEAKLSGVLFSGVQVSTSELFAEMHGNLKLPEFCRLEPTGKASFDDIYKVTQWSGDDVCISPKAELIVTEKCLNVLKKSNIHNCRIIELIF